MVAALQRALRAVRDTLIEEPVSPRVEEPADINLHYCRYVAETVVERVGDEVDVEVIEDGGRGYVHTWLYHDGLHYDAECVEGVDDYRELPFFQRHPEAAVHVEPETADPAALRHRGEGQLYPVMFGRDSSVGLGELGGRDYWRFAVGGVLLGLGLLAAGLAGEWALQRQLIAASPALHTLFVDATLLGEVLVLVSPVVFFLLLPAQRASLRR